MHNLDDALGGVPALVKGIGLGLAAVWRLRVACRWVGGARGSAYVTIDNRREHFLSEAKKAEELAAKATSADVRASWLKIAEGYRQLAQNASGKRG